MNLIFYFVQDIYPIMKAFRILLLVFCATATAQNLTNTAIFGGDFDPNRLESYRSMNDGRHFTVLETDKDDESSRLIKYAYLDGKAKKVLLASSDSIPYFTSYSFSKDENKILIATSEFPIYRRSKQAIYYIYDLTNQKLIPLFDPENSYPWVQEPRFSPDGSKIAFVHLRNLFIKDLLTGTLQKVTNDGSATIINGLTDWVYEEEFGFVRAFDWNVTGTQLAYMRFDESEVPIFSMDIYGKDLYPFPYQFRYPKAGETNATLSMHVYNLKTKSSRNIGFGEETPEYIPRFQFSKDSKLLSVQSLNRHQNYLKLWQIDVTTGTAKVLLEEKDERYVDVHSNLRFLEDNSFLWTSERDGFNHLYYYNSDGSLRRQLTRGNWEITSFDLYSPETQEVYFTSTEIGSTQRAVYALRLNGKRKRLLSYDQGYNGALFSKNARYYIHSFSDAITPPVYQLRKTSNGKILRTVLKNTALKANMEALNLPKKEFGTLTVNGNELNMWMLKPIDFDPNKKYPLLLFQYSGPGSQQVANRWGSQRDLWHYLLTQKDVVVACVDGRGTGFRGADFKKQTYLNLVKYETEDQIEAAKQLGTRSFIDASRIGIWGWSFGGHMALQSILTGNDVFSTAISVAPVTTWRFYDTIYTERFMRTPQENPDGYDLNSPLNYADQLKGKLLLVHGSGDDNVHVQNSMRMINALIEADKPFEWAIYPDKNHGIDAGNALIHLYQKMTTFIESNL